MTEMTWPAQITETLSLKKTRRFCTRNQSTTPSSLPRHQLYNHARSRRFPHHGQGCQAHRPREHHCPRRRRPRVSTSPPISSPEKKVSTIGGTSRYAGARDASPSRTSLVRAIRFAILTIASRHPPFFTSGASAAAPPPRASSPSSSPPTRLPRRPRPSAAPLSRRRRPSPPTATPAPASASTRPPARSSRTRRRRSSRPTASTPSPASKRPHGDKERRVLASPSVDLYSLFIPTSEGRPRRVNLSRWLIA